MDRNHRNNFNKLQLIGMILFFSNFTLSIVIRWWGYLYLVVIFIYFILYIIGWAQAYLYERSKPMSLIVLAFCLLLGLYIYALPFIPIIFLFYIVMVFIKRKSIKINSPVHTAKIDQSSD